MGRRRLSIMFAALVALAVQTFASPAASQGLSPPVFSTIDANGIDVSRGVPRFTSADVSIGQPGAGGLIFERFYLGGTWLYNFVGTVNQGGSTYTVSIGDSSETFTLTGGAFVSNQAEGSTLVDDGSNYIYTTALGLRAIFSQTLANNGSPWSENAGLLEAIQTPAGELLTFHYVLVMTSFGEYFEPGTRLQSITNNFGYQLHFQYARDDAFTPPDLFDWKRIIKVTAINNAVDYCDPRAPICTGLTQTWPAATYALSGSYELVTDALNRQTRLTYGAGGLVAIRRPSSTSADHVTITYSSGRVGSVSNGTGTWTYAYSDNAGVRTTTITDPLSHTRVVTSNIANGIVLTGRDGENRTVSYQYDSNNRLTRVTMPEGNYTQFTLDGRGNVTQITEVPKTGSGLANIVTTASYQATCSNPVTCNQPDSATDARGFRTDYTYNSTHGGVLTVTSPAPSGSPPIGSGVRPQMRFTYEQRTARYYTAAGTATNGTPVYVPISASSCATSSSCAGGADETISTVTYPSAGSLNNLLPLSSSAGAGNGSLTAAMAFTYDNIGNLLTVDGPLAGTADTTRYRFDAARQLIGVVGPDPDGGGALKHRATRVTYNLDGQPTAIERGTVNGQSDANWSAFVSLETVSTAYDFIGRPTRVSLAAGGGTHRVTQITYDNANRLECSAIRMNTAIFGSLPASACTLGTKGSFGADRIERLTYNNADQPTKLTTGYGSVNPIDEWIAAYTSNGLVATLADGAGNLTTYEYDGFDRIHRIRFPNTSGGGSSNADYEQYTYDIPNGRITMQMRGPSPPTRTFTHDNIGRLTLSDASSNGQDISYAYDNFGRLTSAAISGHSLTFTYDQLSRLLSEQGPLGAGTYTTSYQYDLASRRTRMTWPDGLYAQYDWNLADEITAIRENGATSGTGVLAQYAYDDLGRRTAITRGNGVGTSYTYASSLLLQQLSHDLSGTSQDQSITFSHNPADQIVSRTGSNASYQWAPLPGATTSYADNGLNQYTSVAGVTQSHDARGNLTTGGFAYDIDNQLIGGPNSAVLTYDPLGRLHQTDSASVAPTRFLYDGDQIMAEYDDTGMLLTRFVPGPGIDEPTIWYEGSSTSDRRWLLADHLGSILAVTNGSAVATTINTYDEFGVRGASNAGRFQYTGQPWLPEVSLYHYRMRAYSPTLGRFLQTDPILYAGGMNLYAYVGNDPLNRVDPWGLTEGEPDESITVTGFSIPGWARASMPPIFPTIAPQVDPRTQTQDEEESIIVRGRRPRQGPFGAMTAIVPIQYSTPAPPQPPRHAACTEATYACLSNPNVGPNDETGASPRERCQNAEAVCNEIASNFSRQTPRAEFFVTFPDRSVVYIRNGRSVVIRRGR